MKERDRNWRMFERNLRMFAFDDEWFKCVWPFCEVLAYRVNVLIHTGGCLKMGKVLSN